MTWQTVPFPDFPGLDLRSSEDTSACLDNLNVDLSTPGVVKTRQGYTAFASLSNAGGRAHQYYSNLTGTFTRQLVVDDGTTLTALSAAGAVVGSSDSTPTLPTTSFARFGSPIAQYLYIANGEELRRWSGAAFATLSSVDVRPRFVAVQPRDNRLVAARQYTTVNAFTASPSRVYFSDAGDPETFNSNNYVDLNPGDGEEITGVCSWGDLLFVFKESKFFIFYGNSTDATGEPVFNYRAVDIGSYVGASAFSEPTAARDGVYFATVDGIFRTRGDRPEMVSAALRPYFRGDTLPFFNGEGIETVKGMTAINDQLYVLVDTDVASPETIMFVYDTTTGSWAYWELANTPQALAGFRRSGGTQEDLITIDGDEAGTYKVRIFGAGATDDSGTAIESRYRTGFYDLGILTEKRVNEMTVWGAGTVNVKMSRDFGSLDTARSFALGTSPAIDRATKKTGKDGLVFSHEFSAASGQWTVYRAQLELEGSRPAGAKTP